MKKKIELFLLILFIIVTIVGLTVVYNSMATLGYSKIGEQALNLAKLTSATLEITDKDLEELRSIEFSELPNNEFNKQLEELFQKAMVSNNIEYVYVISALDEEDVKYTVDDAEKAQFFREEIGTELDYIWLLDYIVDDVLRKEAENTVGYYDDIYRYTSADEHVRDYIKNKESIYCVNDTEWGNTITGYAPLYTEEGTYIGLLGVDIYSADYYDYRDNIIKFGFFILILLAVLLIIILSLRYISDREELHTDMLTGLYRRRYYEKYAHKVVQGLKTKDDSVTVVMLDIDEFKRYNDFYGHMRGDIVIQAICKIIKESAEMYGAKCGRFGGEEFVIIAPNISIDDGNLLCEKIRKDVEQLNIAHENGIANKSVTISIGAYTAYGDKKMTFEQVVESADVGLYRAKHNGRNRFVRHEN